MEFLRKKKIKLLIFIIVVALALIIASYYVDYKLVVSIIESPRAFVYFMKTYIPPDFSDLNYLLGQLLDTFLVAVAATVIGTILAYISSLISTAKTDKNSILNYFFRIIGSLSRNIPSGIWAIVLLIAFWSGLFIGFIALLIGTYGFLLRTFNNTIGEMGKESIEALNATGASFIQIIFRGIIPETMPQVISWGLYSLELNIRNSTIIGLLVPGGIGYVISVSKSSGNYRVVSAATILISLLIIIIDFVTTQIRKRIL